MCRATQLCRGEAVSSPAPMLGRFLPDEIITARMAELADACGAAAVYRAVDAQVDWLGSPLAGRRRLHRQLALLPYRPSDLQAGRGGVPSPPVRDVERPRSPARARRGLPLTRRVSCVYVRGRNQTIIAVV